MPRRPDRERLDKLHCRFHRNQLPQLLLPDPAKQYAAKTVIGDELDKKMILIGVDRVMQ